MATGRNNEIEKVLVELTPLEQITYNLCEIKLEELLSVRNGSDLKAQLGPSYLDTLVMTLLVQSTVPHDFPPLLVQSMQQTLTDISTCSPELREEVIAALDRGDECCICLEKFDAIETIATITNCGHFACKDCILRHVVVNGKDRCPHCRDPLSPIHYQPPRPQNIPGVALPSKLRKLLQLIQNLRDGKTSTKVVVFSRFERVFNQLTEPLTQLGFVVLKLNEESDVGAQDKAIRQFQLQNYVVLLASFETTDFVLDLSSASKIFMVEPWWNPQRDTEAVSRLDRVGRQVPIVRLVAVPTVENGILWLLEDRKRRLISAKEKKSGETKSAAHLRFIKVRDDMSQMSLLEYNGLMEEKHKKYSILVPSKEVKCLINSILAS